MNQNFFFELFDVKTAFVLYIAITILPVQLYFWVSFSGYCVLL